MLIRIFFLIDKTERTQIASKIYQVGKKTRLRDAFGASTARDEARGAIRNQKSIKSIFLLSILKKPRRINGNDTRSSTPIPYV